MKKITIDEEKNEKEFLNDYQQMKQLKSNNVIKERVELYRDFVINLINYIHNSYFGKEFIKSESDIKGHFNWAFDKVLSEFEKEGVIFSDTRELREYFFDYFNMRFYSVETVPHLKSFISFWDEIFYIKSYKDSAKEKEKSVLDALIEIYKLFDVAFNKKIILEKML